MPFQNCFKLLLRLVLCRNLCFFTYSKRSKKRIQFLDEKQNEKLNADELDLSASLRPKFDRNKSVETAKSCELDSDVKIKYGIDPNDQTNRINDKNLIDDNNNLKNKNLFSGELSNRSIHSNLDEIQETEVEESSELDKSKVYREIDQFFVNYDEITDKVEVGKGVFGVVYRAEWHGKVAVKEIEYDSCLEEDSIELQQFYKEIPKLRKMRHTNLILFIGASVNSTKCAIIMSLCYGISLNKLLYGENSDQLIAYKQENFDWVIDVITQIALGMGFLHNKKMLHKDLRSRNIFIDGRKVQISDFGIHPLLNDLCKKQASRNDLLKITKECIFYMAPELVKSIGSKKFGEVFSKKTDVFSFGTVCFEIIYNRYQFDPSIDAETLIFLIGNNFLQNDLIDECDTKMSNNIKNLIVECWSFEPSKRPSFSSLIQQLRAMGKEMAKEKRFVRSPSHPVRII